MIERIVAASIRRRLLVVLLGLVAIVVGASAFRDLKIDAVPDITTVQVQVATRTTPMGAGEVERYVTAPVELALTGLPGVENLRSVSRFGLSAVTVTFHEDVDVYFARQLVSERLVEARERVAEAMGTPEMLPVTTGLGEVYMFALRGGGKTPMELRELLDWEIAPRLRTVPGVIEVAAQGGYAKQFHVVVDPSRLQAHGIGIDQVFDALERSNALTGGGYIERAGRAYSISANGLIESMDDLRRVVVTAHDHTAVTIDNIGRVELGSMPRLGAATMDGRGETVVATVLMLKDANAREVATAVGDEVREIQRSLPPGVRIDTFYDRSTLVNRVVTTVMKNLLEGGALVVIVLFLMLGELRGGAIVASAIPLSMLVAFAAMVETGISGNLMSLGAIDFGLVVDGAVVMVERMLARAAHARSSGADPEQAMREGAAQVARPVTFGVLIIGIVYLPVLTLQGTEGHMFRPMALTVLFALGASLVLALTVVPAVTSFVYRRGSVERETRLLRAVRRLYQPALRWCMRHRGITVAGAALLLCGSVAVLPLMGSEFIPRLEEGDLLLQAWRLPSISLEESVRTTGEIERSLRHFPEVTRVVSRTGTAEVSTDVMGTEVSDVFVNLRPIEQWRSAHSREGLVELIDQRLRREVPGVGISFTQPIEMRFNELISGIKSDVAVKVFGEDLAVLARTGRRIARTLARVPGATDVRVEQVEGQSVVSVRVDRSRLARHGLDAESILRAVEAAGSGRRVGHVFEGSRQFDLVVRVASRGRALRGPSDLADVPIAAGAAGLLPLGQLADVRLEDSPAQVSRESASRRLVVECNVRGRDLGGFIEEARSRVATEVRLGPGYYLRWGGQFENLERARGRLVIAVPIALMLVVVLLLLSFGSARPAALIFTNVPLAASGGIAALALRGLPLSISAGVGFIALFGVAVLNGIVLVSHVRGLEQEGLSRADAAYRGALDRLRPVLTTALVASLGFVPMAFSTSPGAEVQRPLATVVIGGLLTATLVTLFVVPSLYARWGSAAKPAPDAATSRDGSVIDSRASQPLGGA